MTSLLRDVLLIFVSFHAYHIPHDTHCLRLDPLTVPPVALVGTTVNLVCPFSLEGDRLYSVMWYKDHEEFYRFVPRNNPMQHSYKLDGFHVDVFHSNESNVFLEDLTLKASGVFRCEVSAEAPSFTSVHAESSLQVISIPNEDPEISGQESTYAVGDIMALNCTSGKSFPPAQLDWFINDDRINSDFEFEAREDIEDSQLVTSTATLHLQLQPQHFFHGQMVIRCVASVGPIQTSAHISPLLVNHKETSLLVQARGSSSPTQCPIFLMTTLSTLFIIIAAYFTSGK